MRKKICCLIPKLLILITHTQIINVEEILTTLVIVLPNKIPKILLMADTKNL